MASRQQATNRCRKKLAPKPGTKPRPKLKPELEAAWREQQRARRPSPSPATTPQDLYDVPKATSSSSQEAIYDRPKEQGSPSVESKHGNGAETEEIDRNVEDIYDQPRSVSAAIPIQGEVLYDHPKRAETFSGEDLYDVPKPVVANGSIPLSSPGSKNDRQRAETFAVDELPSTKPPIPPRTRQASLLSFNTPYSDERRRNLPRSVTIGAFSERLPSPSNPAPGGGEIDLNKCSWYWGKATREEVKHKLRNEPDGSFMIRDASGSVGEYTLTVRKDGDNKLIRILHGNGSYGFSDPLTFKSIIALVEFYQKESLKEYNAKLDVCLTNPVPRYYDDEDVVSVVAVAAAAAAEQKPSEPLWKLKLKRVEEEFNDTNEKFGLLYEQHVQALQRIASLLSQIRSQEVLIKLFEDQIELAERYNDEHAKDEEKDEIANNSSRLRERLEAANWKLRDMREELQDLQSSSKEIDCEMNALKPLIMQLQSRKAHYVDVLRQRGDEDPPDPGKTYTLFDPRNIRRSKRRTTKESSSSSSTIYQNREPLLNPPENPDVLSPSPPSSTAIGSSPPPPPPRKQSGDSRPPSRTISECGSPTTTPMIPPPPFSSPIRTPPRHLPKQMSTPDSFAMGSSYQDRAAYRHMSLGAGPSSFPQRNPGLGMPQNPEGNWFMGKINRKFAQSMLQQGYSNGTFLVREKEGQWDPSQPKMHTHSVDIIYHGQIKHIQIFRYSDGCFGFSEELKFATLHELVEHHRQESLKKYNPDLDTALVYPVGGNF
ncbi:phosphatidylinositol 3-kinase regulatory subunit gamma-like isoform X2 [Oscarella lobularis]|uniref:phosphatidylinositol 3-kinase regulatory subunit gamma-like isoform X2 n=1 Tax=Oscarella lobularis TaxID=121494 RepID=UPI0033143866